MTDVEFLVSKTPLRPHRHPAIGVDGPVRGADLLFDHHASGEAVNLEAIPDRVPSPAILATTSLDSDAVISAAVVLLRARGEHAAVRALMPQLYEAAHYCDYLMPSGRHPLVEREGLGLHCWLKERGFGLAEVRSWAAGDLRAGEDGRECPRPSPDTKSWVFGELTRAMVEAIRRGALPCDFVYLERLTTMEAAARRGIRRLDGRVTVLALDAYVDPLALYRVALTDVALLMTPIETGAYRYQLGVHPRAYARIDLTPLFARLNRDEPGWGGRTNAGGSPMETGSRLSLDALVSLLNTDVVLPARTRGRTE